MLRELLNENQLRVIEFVPQSRVVKFTKWNPKSRKWTEIKKFLSFPYVQFVQTPLSLHVGASNAPIDNIEDVVGMLPLGNIYGNHQVCLGDLDYSLSNEAINEFWTTPFGIDAGWTGVSVAEDRLGGYDNWEKQTALDNQYALNRDWTLGGRPLIKLIEDARLKKEGK
jgi:hypothetical protein